MQAYAIIVAVQLHLKQCIILSAVILLTDNADSSCSGGAGGKGVWGAAGMVYEDEEPDIHDPNYDESYQVRPLGGLSFNTSDYLLAGLFYICKSFAFKCWHPAVRGFCLFVFPFQQSVHWMAPFISLCPRSDSELLMRYIVINLSCYAETPEMLTVGFPGKYKTVFISKILTSFV